VKSLSLKIITLIALSLVIACEKTEGEGSGSLDPGSNNPEIVEGVLCGNIFDGNPQEIDNQFFADDIVYLWLSWKNVAGEHEVRVIWVDPDDNVISETVKKFNSSSGNQITHFYIDTTSSAPNGRWIAEIQIDGSFARSYAFWITQG
jgi:hypothetical protein